MKNMRSILFCDVVAGFRVCPLQIVCPENSLSSHGTFHLIKICLENRARESPRFRSHFDLGATCIDPFRGIEIHSLSESLGGSESHELSS